MKRDTDWRKSCTRQVVFDIWYFNSSFSTPSNVVLYISTEHICMTNTLKSLKFDLSPLFFQSTLLFLIVTYDTTNKIFSLVYAFVDSDTANSWRWILECFCCNMVIKKWEVYIILYSHIDNKLVVVKVFSNSWDDHNIVHILAMTSNFNTQFKGQHLENKFYIKCSGQFLRSILIDGLNPSQTWTMTNLING